MNEKTKNTLKIVAAAIALAIIFSVPGFIVGENVTLARVDAFEDRQVEACAEALQRCVDACPLAENKSFNVTIGGEQFE